MLPDLSILVPAGAAADATRALAPAGAEVVPVDVPASETHAAALNRAAHDARGEVLIVLNAVPGAGFPFAELAQFCADPGVGAVGTGGSILIPAGAGKPGFSLLPLMALQRGDGSDGLTDCDLLDRSCFAVQRRRFLELGGFDETFGDGDEIFDICLRLRERNLRVVSDPRIARTSLPSELPRSSDAAARRRLFLERWFPRAKPRPNIWCERGGMLLRLDASFSGNRITVPVPEVTIFVHGPEPADRTAFEAALRNTRLQAARIVWTADSTAATAARDLTENRGEAYVAFVRTDTLVASQWLNALVDALERDDDGVAATAAPVLDARCVVVAPRLVPQHLRIDGALTLETGLVSWIEGAVAAGRSVTHVPEAATLAPSPALAPAARVSAVRPPALASIVMLSWNAPEFTEGAVASIALHTRFPHEIVLVDNGSGPETRARLARLEGVRIIYNEHNMGFAHGSNQGAAAARGTHIVLLNNDVLVTDGWLDALVGLQQRRPAVGLSVPMSDNVHGHQQVADAPVELERLPAFAAERSRRLTGRWYRTDVAMGLCMCVAREVIEEVGGMDPRYGVGNFEDVDFCVRVRAAGYEIGVCEDAFVHHFGSVSFRANNIDYAGQTAANLDRFVQRWNVDPQLPLSSAVLAPIRRGFSAASDYVPFPPVD